MSKIKKIISLLYHKTIKPIYYNILRFRDWTIYNSHILPKPKYNKDLNISICAIFKNEARFLKEWIEYHELIGVEHFYLYNNNSNDNYKEVLKDYIDHNLVTLIEWPQEQGQITAYKHFYDTFWNQAQWISFLDIDEFIVPKNDSNLLNWLKRREKYPVNLIYWKMFGSSGLLKHDDTKLCTEQYLFSWESLVKCGKCLINTDFNISNFDYSVHHATKVKYKNIRIKLHPVDQFNHIFIGDKESILGLGKSNRSDIQINHYWSKAWDIYNLKRSWSGDVFFKQNPKSNIQYFIKNEVRNSTSDLSIQRFILMLKWKINDRPEYEEMKNSEKN